MKGLFHFFWVCALAVSGYAAAEPWPDTAAVELGRLFTTPEQRLRIAAEGAGTPTPTAGHFGPPAPVSTVMPSMHAIEPQAPSAGPEPHMHGVLRRGDIALVEWPHPQRDMRPVVRAGVRRLQLDRPQHGGGLRRGLQEIAEWTR